MVLAWIAEVFVAQQYSNSRQSEEEDEVNEILSCTVALIFYKSNAVRRISDLLNENYCLKVDFNHKFLWILISQNHLPKRILIHLSVCMDCCDNDYTVIYVANLYYETIYTECEMWLYKSFVKRSIAHRL